MKIKICGINSIEAAQAVQQYRPDYAGFVFYPKSPRHISYEQAKQLADIITIPKVAVTVDANNDELEEIIANLQPDFLQLHGDETVERIKQIKQQFDLPIIKAFGISTADDLQKIKPFADIADYFLFDAKPPKHSNIPGGNAVSFDWNILKDYISSKPYFLSGGLNNSNLSQAIQISGAKYIDLSSGVESAKGVKSPQLIKQVIETARAI